MSSIAPLPDGRASSPAIVPSSEASAIDLAVAALERGELIGIPTETVYGIASLPRVELLEALLDAKRRPTDKGFQVIVDGLDQVAHLVNVSDVAARLAERFWPGPLTLALPLRSGVSVPDLLTGGRGTLGLRIPDHPVPRTIARRVGPIAVSSANLSGEPAALDVAALIAAVGQALSVVVDDGHVRGGVASTVVGVASDGTLTFFRLGALPEDEIRGAVADTAG